MFAGKFRSWMEAHLGRPKKNKQPKEKAGKQGAQGPGAARGPDAVAVDHNPAQLTDLPASSHLHRGPLTAESLDSISTCPTTGSERGGLSRPHVNLSSPESAYSTGYSTDGTSPGASFPPEYYINLRTGTHYFHSLAPGVPVGVPPLPAGPAGLPPAPHHLHHGMPPSLALPPALPPTLPHAAGLSLNLPPGLPPLPTALQPALHSLQSRQPWGWPTGLVQQAEPPRVSYLTPGRSRKQQHQQQQHQQLLLEQQQQHLNLLQQQQTQHQLLLQKQQQIYQKQQQKQQQQFIHALSRTESSTEEDLVGKAGRPSSTSSSTISSHSASSSARHWQPSDCVSSPRARTRIRTNPWLPTSPAPTPNATPTPRTRSQQQHQQQQLQQQPSNRQGLGGCSSSLSLSSSSSYGSTSDVSLQRRSGAVSSGRSRSRGGSRMTPRPQPLFQLNEESPSVEDKPLPRGPVPVQVQPSPRPSPASAALANGRASRASNRTPARSLSVPGNARKRSPSASSSSSASSRTANNGSPPNLSDNEDVTLNEMMGKFDESYVYEKETDILSDSDPTDVEDYGDDGGDEQTEEDPEELDFIDRGSVSELCDVHVNRGHCTFHNYPPGRRQSSRRRSSRREPPSASRDSSASPRGSRTNSRASTAGSRTPSDRRRRRGAPAPHPGVSADSFTVDGPLGGTLGAVNAALTNTNLNRIVMQRLLLRGADLGAACTGTRSAGSTPISARRNHPRVPDVGHHHDYALAEADREADRKYRQLIMQAEHILVSMTGSPAHSPMNSPLAMRAHNVHHAPHYGTPPMSKRVPVANLNRRLDYIKQGLSPHCPSPLARRTNDNAEENRNRWSPLVMPRRALVDSERLDRGFEAGRKQCFTPSPSGFRRALPATPTAAPLDEKHSPLLFIRRGSVSEAEAVAVSPLSTPGGTRRARGPPPVPPPRTVTAYTPPPQRPQPASTPPPVTPAPRAAEPRACKSFQLNLKSLTTQPSSTRSSNKGWSAIEASSSDSDGSLTPRPFVDRRAKSTATTPTSTRPPLVTYKSVDHRLDAIDACPQSEPVKRKVYAGSHTLDRLSKKLEHTEIMPRTPTTPVQEKEEARRKNMLMETLQQLKQSLESQSASLQMPA